MSSGRRILVIDDTELIRTIYRDRLSAEGFDVALASDGVEGLAMAVEDPPDLILLDLVMPRQNGLDTLEKLKSDPRTHGVPVIILSNRDDQAEISAGLRLGAVDFLKKVGASPAEVSEKIRAILDRAAAEAHAGAAEAAEAPEAAESWKLYVRDREADADAVVEQMALQRRFWCPACELELALEIVKDPQASGGHWFKAHFVCTSCNRTF